MAFHMEQSFTVDASADSVWRFLIDPRRVASCLPGAAITEQLDDDTYAGTMTVKVGPVSASYKGKVTFKRLDRDSREAEIVASGQDVRGKGGATMNMVSRVKEETPDRTEVTLISDVSVTGILAQFGRGMIQDVSDQMLERFTAAMQEQLAVDGAGKKGNVEGKTGNGERETEGGQREAGSGKREARDAGAGELDLVALGAAAGKRAVARTLRSPGLWVAVAVVLIATLWFLL